MKTYLLIFTLIMAGSCILLTTLYVRETEVVRYLFLTGALPALGLTIFGTWVLLKRSDQLDGPMHPEQDQTK